MNKFVEKPASKTSLLLRKPIYGVGINDSKYIVNHSVCGKMYRCEFYRAWVSMITRCYSEKYLKRMPAYIGCSVCREWHIFSNFKKWMKTQDWRGKALDKDLLIPGNKIYSPSTCLFVTQEINNLLNDRMARRGKWPQGVSYDKVNNKYVAQCSDNGTHKKLGRYKTPGEASLVYKKFKSNLVFNIALDQSEPLKSALISHSELILNVDEAGVY